MLAFLKENFLPDDFPSFGVSPPRYECQPVSNLTLSCSPPSSRINFDAYSDCQVGATVFQLLFSLTFNRSVNVILYT